MHWYCTVGNHGKTKKKRGEMRKNENLPFQQLLQIVLVVHELFVWLVLLLMPHQRFHARGDSECVERDYI